jgi:DNA repair protein RadA/Sms
MKLKIKNEEVVFGTNITNIKVPDALRRKIKTGVEYFDDICGGQGLTPSSVMLFTGTPGAGKSTMMLKLAESINKNGSSALFNTGEESIYQVKLSCERLKINSGFPIGQITNPHKLIEECDKFRNRPENKGKDFVLIIDSLQTLNDEKYGHKTNNKTPERCLSIITDWCKQTMSSAIVIGQVGKDGNFIGTNVLKHMVDSMVTLTIETKDPDLYGCRILNNVKNRFGSSGIQIWGHMTKTNPFDEVARIGTV